VSEAFGDSMPAPSVCGREKSETNQRFGFRASCLWPTQTGTTGDCGRRFGTWFAATASSRAPPGVNCRGSNMPTAKKSSAKTGTTKAAASHDAVQLLTADHKEVKQLFKQYEKLVDQEADDAEKKQLAEQICGMLTVHATIEEEIFYPAAREQLDEQDLLDEAEVEHASAKDLIAQIQSMEPSEELYDAKVTVLGEYIDHHVKEEEGEMFPKVKKTELDLKALGEELAARKQELMAESGAAEDA
jgi:hemerythrin superfamily protein